MRPLRVAHLVSHPVPYHVPLYRELARRKDIDLTVYFYSDGSLRGYRDTEFGREVRWDAPLLEGYASRFPPSAAGAPIEGTLGVPPNLDLLAEVARARPDAVWVHGYGYYNPWLLAPWLVARGIPLLIREEQTLLHPRRPLTAGVKALALRTLFSVSWGLYIGEQSRRYFLHYGMPPERLFPARYNVDNRWFRAQHEQLAPQREELRRRFGIQDDAPVVLLVGRLVPRKQPVALVEAVARARARARHACHLLIVGEGPELERARDRAAQLELEGVHFAGFLNQTEIGAAYTAADIFVLPSREHETWGLVVNEAMNFGLPVVLARTVGSASDLVREGWNGYTFDADDDRALAAILERLVADPELRGRLGAHSVEVVDEFGVERCADEIVEACTAAVAVSRGSGKTALCAE